MKTYEEFLDELLSKKLIDRQDFKKQSLSNRWCTGGVGGGSCYGDSEHYPIEPDPKPDFSDIDNIFEAYFPEIGFLQYKKFIGEYVKYSIDTTYEYYGNSNIYAIETVSLSDLYDYLVDHNKL